MHPAHPEFIIAAALGNFVISAFLAGWSVYRLKLTGRLKFSLGVLILCCFLASLFVGLWIGEGFWPSIVLLIPLPLWIMAATAQLTLWRRKDEITAANLGLGVLIGGAIFFGNWLVFASLAMS
jgi:hypothetical protein